MNGERSSKRGHWHAKALTKAPQGIEEPALIGTHGRIGEIIQNTVRLLGPSYERIQFRQKDLIE